MKPDGSGQEQLTFDEYRDWFPHISPDNKWIVFLSYPTNVVSYDHLFYKRVLLQMMPGSGRP
jgi:TolB protein